MSISSYGYSGNPASGLVPQFNPNVFPTELRARAWPGMMQHVPTPAASPIAASGLPGQTGDHAGLMDETDLTTTAMYTVANAADGAYRPALIMPDSYIVSMRIPARDQTHTVALRQREGKSYCSTVYAMTVSMLNAYMRAQHTKLQNMASLRGQADAIRQRAGNNDQMYTDILDNDISGLSVDDKHTLYFENPTAAATQFYFLGPVVSQPNALMSVVGGQVQSTSANAGMTQFSVATGGVPRMSNYWGRHGLVTCKQLWFVLMRAGPHLSYMECVRAGRLTDAERKKMGTMLSIDIKDSTGLPVQYPPQLVPWCANESTGRKMEAGAAPTSTYVHVGVPLSEVLAGLAVTYRVGATLSTSKADFNTSQDVYNKIAGLVDYDIATGQPGPVPDLSASALLQTRVPLLDVMLHEKRGGSAVQF